MNKPSKRVITPSDDLTYKIIGCAMAVHRNLGPGYREDTYQRDLEVYLKESQVAFEAQKQYEVFDSMNSEELIGYYIPDFIVEEKVVVEIKALRGLDNSHLAQVIGYLKVTGFQVGLLMNFGERSLKYRRVFPPENIIEHRVNRQWLFIPPWLKQQNEDLNRASGK
jgi:GxxExxY protein